MAVTKFVALVLCALAGSAAAMNLACPAPGSPTRPGGYTPVEDQTTLDSMVEYASLAFEEFLSTGNATLPANCVDEDPVYSITDACTQVVQGTNTIVEFTATLCGMDMDGAVKVFEPLESDNGVLEMIDYEIMTV